MGCVASKNATATRTADVVLNDRSPDDLPDGICDGCDAMLYPSQPRWCCTSAACDRQRYCVKCSTAPCRIHGLPLWRDPEAPHRLTARVHAGRLARYVSDGVAAAGLTDMNFVGSAELLRRAFHHYDSMPCIGVVAGV